MFLTLTVSGLISVGASTGAAFGATSTGFGAADGAEAVGEAEAVEAVALQRHHCGRRWQHVGGHQRNDYDGPNEHRCTMIDSGTVHTSGRLL
jgi:hypothetical protein